MKYRFKTKEEFTKEFGEKWYLILGEPEFGGWIWTPHMDNLFGITLNQDFPDNERYIKIIDKFNRTWFITRFMLKEYIPNYKPRKIIREI